YLPPIFRFSRLRDAVAYIDLPPSTFNQFSDSRNCETQLPTLTFHLLPSTNFPFLATARRSCLH
ncbi:MAG: hypothetical protein IJR53_11265, partial [Bacteroidales bacterium]|nr:hypothetical protein [Bacteroidales bacterium]